MAIHKTDPGVTYCDRIVARRLSISVDEVHAAIGRVQDAHSRATRYRTADGLVIARCPDVADADVKLVREWHQVHESIEASMDGELVELDLAGVGIVVRRRPGKRPTFLLVTARTLHAVRRRARRVPLPGSRHPRESDRLDELVDQRLRSLTSAPVGPPAPIAGIPT